MLLAASTASINSGALFELKNWAQPLAHATPHDWHVTIAVITGFFQMPDCMQCSLTSAPLGLEDLQRHGDKLSFLA